MNKYIFWCLILLLLTNCNKEEEAVRPLGAECMGINMVGEWSLVDSVEMIFLDVDSIDHQVYYSDMILYNDGIGKLIFQPSLNIDNYYLLWNLQCDPDIFTISIPYNNEDSIFNASELYSVAPYEILVNELKFKRRTIDSQYELCSSRICNYPGYFYCYG